MGEEQLLPVQLDAVGDPDVAAVPAGRVEAVACIIDSWVPTASMTQCASSPSVRSLIAARPASPRAGTMLGAPYSTANCWRDSWRRIGACLHGRATERRGD